MPPAHRSGALSIITAAPRFEPTGRILVLAGNCNALHTTGYATGPLADRWAVRIPFQTRGP